MSALPPKTDIRSALAHVCFVPKADIVLRNRHGGFAPSRKSRAQGEGSDGPPGSAELTRTPINHAMPSSIIAALGLRGDFLACLPQSSVGVILRIAWPLPNGSLTLLIKLG